MVTGAYPPEVCGVGDYTYRLMAAAPPTWQLFVERDWSPGAAFGIVRRLLARRPTDVIIQYPTQGYGWSLVPHLLILIGGLTRLYRGILALHEFTSLSGKAQWALALVSHFASHIIFTTEVERDRARAHPLFSSRVETSIIGILSNIPWTDPMPRFDGRTIDIAYFGHVRPNKGLEDFLDVMAGIRHTDQTIRIAVIGEIPRGYEDFGLMAAERCREIGAELILGLDDAEAGCRLADIKILYLPFRDGVSARRGTALAGLGNGALLATRLGNATPTSLLPAIIPCSGTASDIDTLLSSLRLSNDEAARFQMAGRTYIDAMLPLDWGHVATLYESAIADAIGPVAQPIGSSSS